MVKHAAISLYINVAYKNEFQIYIKFVTIVRTTK